MKPSDEMLPDQTSGPRLPDNIVRRITVVRYMLGLASEQARSHRVAAAFVAINTLQDALELFLLTASDYCGVNVPPRADFDKLFDGVNTALAGSPLPFRNRLIAANKMRVSSKHHGVQPSAEELDRALDLAGNFFEEATPRIFNVPLASISLVNQLEEGAARGFLTSAQKAYEAGNLREVLIECRKAFYVTFEESADISPFGLGTGGILSSSGAPFFARTSDYYDKSVREPADAIILDTARLEAEIVAEGIDVVAFWNVYRLTPAMRRDEKRGWLIQEKLWLYTQSELAERASYVLDNIVEIILRFQHRRRSRRWSRDHKWLDVVTTGETTPVYLKADVESEQVISLPLGTQLRVRHSTPGLKDDVRFFAVAGVVEDAASLEDFVAKSFSGYVLPNTVSKSRADKA